MSAASLPKPPKVPCGSCPYRKDVPSGVWHESEYRKLPAFDNETMAQPTALFMCHQQDGCICGGWLMTHDTDHLLALRLRPVHESAYNYSPDVDVFESGQAACDHGLKHVDNPSADAMGKIKGLKKLRKSKQGWKS